MIKLYGLDGRSFRCAWALEEAGVSYERVPLRFKEDTKSPDFLELNPNGKIPVLADGELVIFESLAINLHIAKTHGDDLWPSTPVKQSRTIQWMAWGMGELEGPHDAANRTNTEIDKERLDRALEAIRLPLKRNKYLLGDSFTIADLNTAALLMRPQFSRIAAEDNDLGGWFERCASREALTRAFEVKPDNG